MIVKKKKLYYDKMLTDEQKTLNRRLAQTTYYFKTHDTRLRNDCLRRMAKGAVPKPGTLEKVGLKNSETPGQDKTF